MQESPAGQSAGIGKDHFLSVPAFSRSGGSGFPVRGPANSFWICFFMIFAVSRNVCFLCSFYDLVHLYSFACSLYILHTHTIYVGNHSVSHFFNSHCRYQRSARNIHNKGAFSRKYQRVFGSFFL